MTEKPEPVSAWGIVNYGGTLMPQAFMQRSDAEIDKIRRWPNDAGLSRVIPVTITAKDE